MARGKVFGYLEGDGGGKSQRLSRDIAKHEAWVEAILPASADTASSDDGDINRRPLVIFISIIGVITAVLVIRLFLLQVVSGGHNLALANGNRIRERVERAPRGVIYDRNNAVLAQNQASFDVTVIPQQLPKKPTDRQNLYDHVATLTGVPAATIATASEITCKTDKSPSCLASPIPQLVYPGLARDQALVFDQNSASLPGFYLDVNPIRQYTDNNLLSVFLGYTGRVNSDEAASDPTYGPTDLIGKLGIEKQYESVLRGTNGGEQTEVDATGKPIRVLASRNPVAGNSVVLSVDSGLEQHLSDAIAKQMAASGAQRAAGVAINPKTGEVLAAVSLPGYDNNEFSKGISQSHYQGLLANPGQPLFNKVASGAYASGSIIKPFGAAAALQEGVISSATTVDDTGKIVIPNKYDPAHPSIYLGWERTTGLGQVNVVSAIARSSDIFFYEVMGGFTSFTHYLGVDKLTQYYKLFGLGTRTGIDLPSEAAGRVPTPDWKKAFSGQAWYTGDTYNIAVGQGDLLVSPLQMVTAVAAIANGGTLYKPHFVTKIVDPSGKLVQQVAPEITRQGFISPANLSLVRQGMFMAVNDANGTACCRIKAEVPVQVAAKTGTAETVVHDAGTSEALQSKPNAWFEAFAPYNDPKIAIVVLIEHSGEGAEYAAPAVREALTWYFTAGAGAK